MVSIRSVSSTDLFVGTEENPLQLLRVSLEAGPEASTVWVEGDGVRTPEPVTVAGGWAGDVEVAVAVAPPATEGAVRPVTVHAESGTERISHPAELTVSEPGWTMIMVPHFHYDPFWWNTQAGYLATWDDQPQAAQDGRKPGQAAAFDVLRAHLGLADRDPDHKFVLAGLDYLKPYWDTHPRERADLRRLMAEGRVELVGGMYNEPNTNLTSLESTIRNILLGTRFQRDVVGSDTDMGWMLDVFGHDPSLPAVLADAGLATVVTARGPFHRWGPAVTTGDVSGMQFPTEFEWIAPDGRGVLCGYLAHHYPAGWRLNEVDTLEEAEAEAYERFRSLKRSAATRNVILPVGYNHVIPARWTTEVHRDWRKRHVWPRFVVGLPSEFFDRVRAEMAERGAQFSPQSRDMNPVYPGKDVSYIDVKQAHRAAETTLLDGERLATLASLLGARFPAEAVDKAWRQLLFCSHHDGITGVASDQVYLDLAGGWREAYELASGVRRAAVAHLAAHVDSRGDGAALIVFNAQSWARTDLVSATIAGTGLCDGSGVPVPAAVSEIRRDAAGSVVSVTLTFVATDVPAGGYRVYRIRRNTDPAGSQWRAVDGERAESDRFLIEADPGRGGGLSRMLDKRAGRELLRDGEVGASLVVDDEYTDHPAFGKGPWHIVPTGVRAAASAGAGTVRAETSPAGERIIATSEIGDLRLTTETTVWNGLSRIEFSTRVDGSIGQDHLLRVCFPFDLPGARPIYEVGNAAVGRTFGYTRVDTAKHPFVLDSPAHTWVGLSSAATIAFRDGTRVAVGVVEIVAPEDVDVRDLVAALAAKGVTATTSRPDGGRCGSLDLDSNLPDLRIRIGGRAGVRAHERIWFPATETPSWEPGIDLRGDHALPVLALGGPEAVAEVVRDLADGTIEVDQAGDGKRFDDHSVAVLNRGTPGAVVEPDGTIAVSLMRSSGGWPAGTWIDEPRRTAPDGSSFALQHWSHTFDYSVVSDAGDWRAAGFVRAGHAYNSRLLSRAEPAHAGVLPPAATSLLSAEPENVELTAFKPGADGLVLRCYETAGRPVTARIRSFVPLLKPMLADIQERPRQPLAEAISVELGASRTATVLAVPDPPRPATPGAPVAELGPRGEPADPVFARYWLHGRGAAPMEDSGVAVYVQPRAVDLRRPATVRVMVTSTRAARGVVTLVVPPQVRAIAGDLAFDVVDGFQEFEVELSPVPGAAAGVCHLAARAAGVEDVCAIRLGDAAADQPVAVTVETPEVTAPGELRIRIESRRADEVRGEAQLITPFGAWDLIGPWTREFRLEPYGNAVLRYPAQLPPGTRPGVFWALVKVMAFGSVAYTEAVPITVPVRAGGPQSRR